MPGIKEEDRKVDASNPEARPYDRENEVTRNINKRVSRILWEMRFQGTKGYTAE